MTKGMTQPELAGTLDRQEALIALLPPGSGPQQAKRFEHYASRNRIVLDLLWLQRDQNGRIDSSVLCAPAAGRTAMVFSSPTLHQSQVSTRATLIRHALEALRDEDIDLAQALLPCEDRLAEAAHLAGGFGHLATLVYMERRLTSSSPAPRVPKGVELVLCDEAPETTLSSVLEASYEGTLDCPGLCGLRQTRDIIAGHRAMGCVEPEGWILLKVDGHFEGVIMINRSPDESGYELAYLGISKAVRSRGLGRVLLEEVVHRFSGRGPGRMTLAADANNTPAISLYASMGFTANMRRTACIRPVTP
jgi:mycothiol synthase